MNVQTSVQCLLFAPKATSTSKRSSNKKQYHKQQMQKFIQGMTEKCTVTTCVGNKPSNHTKLQLMHKTVTSKYKITVKTCLPDMETVQIIGYSIDIPNRLQPQ